MKKLLLISLVFLFFSGCGVNWKSRTGVYTYDEAVREYGPPDYSEILNNGDTACSWTTSIGKNWIDRLILVFDEKGTLKSGEEKRL